LAEAGIIEHRGERRAAAALFAKIRDPGREPLILTDRSAARRVGVTLASHVSAAQRGSVRQKVGLDLVARRIAV
jgi:hypothetical protein